MGVARGRNSLPQGKPEPGKYVDTQKEGKKRSRRFVHRVLSINSAGMIDSMMSDVRRNEVFHAAKACLVIAPSGRRSWTDLANVQLD